MDAVCPQRHGHKSAIELCLPLLLVGYLARAGTVVEHSLLKDVDLGDILDRRSHLGLWLLDDVLVNGATSDT
jgi:hypothetical protein